MHSLAGQILINGSVGGSAYGLTAMAFALAFVAARYYKFAQGAIYTVAAYIAFIAVTVWHWPLVAAAGGAVVLGTVGSMFVEGTLMGELRRRGTNAFLMFLASLGVLMVVQNIVAVVAGDASLSYRPHFTTRIYDLGIGRATGVQLAGVAVAAIAFVSLASVERFTTFGIRVRAAADDPELARLLGANAQKLILAAVGIAGVFLGMAAVLQPLDTDLRPIIGSDMLLPAVFGAIAGGTRYPSGAFIAGLLLGLAREFSVLVVGSEWQDAVAFGLVFVLLVARRRV